MAFALKQAAAKTVAAKATGRRAVVVRATKYDDELIQTAVSEACEAGLVGSAHPTHNRALLWISALQPMVQRSWF
jgi:hypothetical protein